MNRFSVGRATIELKEVLNMFDKVQKMVLLSQLKALSRTLEIPIHSIRRVAAGDRGVRYCHIEKLYKFYFGDKD